uniref:GYF domain-containing protein n=2 Tax=Ciona intestinalis TaxID=7719 RepID=F6YGC9_CIOIN
MSAETLNFGPQWLRDLSSGGSNVTSPPPSPATQPLIKFKLAQHRYGREEMLALFEKHDNVPSELFRAPNLISEETLTPLALIPLTEDDQRAFSGGVNSDVMHRSRGPGGPLALGRGRSMPPRGRGRGRGEMFSRSMSQSEDGPSYGRGSREYIRRDSWDDRGFNRNGRSFEDTAPRKPVRRSDASDDWRNDAIRGSGDGNENDKEGGSDWRPPAPRKEGWREPGRGSWREREDRGWSNDTFHRDRRPVNRTRSYGSNKYDSEAGLMPEWADDADESEVGVFDPSGAFQAQKKGGKRGDPKLPRDSDRGIRRNASSFGSLKKIEEKERSRSEREEIGRGGAGSKTPEEKPETKENGKPYGSSGSTPTTPNNQPVLKDHEKHEPTSPEKSPIKEKPAEPEKRPDLVEREVPSPNKSVESLEE